MLHSFLGGLSGASLQSIERTQQKSYTDIGTVASGEKQSWIVSSADGAESSVHAGNALATQASSQRGQGVSGPQSLLFSFPLTPVAPPGRWAHAACATPQGMLVFGGIGQSLLDDAALLCPLSLTWRQLSPSASSSKDVPEKVMGASCAALGNRVFIYGGQQGRKLLSKLFLLDLEALAWRRLSPEGLPPPLAGHAMCSVQAGPSGPARIFMFGGQSKKLEKSLFSFSPEGAAGGVFRQLPEKGKVPSPRRGHSLVWDGQDSLILFGGTTQAGVDSALHVYSLSRGEWSTPQASGPAPSARTQHSAAMVGGHAMLVFGGCNSQGQFFNDTYILDTATFTWHRPLLLNAAPAPRYHHSCVVVGGRTIIYGGINSKQTFDGIVLVDSKGDNDISQIAEELSTMMASNATAPGMRAPSIDHAYSPVAPGSSRSIQTATAGLPVREPSVHGVATGAGSMSGGAGVMDLMKAQLTDLLVKRNLEELQLQAQRKAEAAEAALVKERAASEGLQKELLQLRLLVSEAEAERAQWEGRAKEAAMKLQREAAAAAEAQAQVSALQSQLAAVSEELAGANSLQNGLLKELGILSSRYTRLHQQFEAMRKRRWARAPQQQQGGASSSARNGSSGESGALGHGAMSGGESAAATPSNTPPASSLMQVMLAPGGEEGAAGAQVANPSSPGGLPAAWQTPPNGLLEGYNSRSSSPDEEYEPFSMSDPPTLDAFAALQQHRPGSAARGGPTAGLAAAAAAAAAGLLAADGAAAAAAAAAHADGRGGNRAAAGPVAGLLGGAHPPAIPDPTACVSSASGLPVGASAAAVAAAAAAAAATGPAAASAGPATASACEQLLRLLNVAEGQRAALVEELAAQQAAATALAAEKEEAEEKLCALKAAPDTLQAMSIGQLSELEAELERSARTVREAALRRRVEEMAAAAARTTSEQAACSVCLEAPKNLVFNCGHQTCCGCGEKLTACPFCRVTITTKIKLFDA